MTFSRTKLLSTFCLVAMATLPGWSQTVGTFSQTVSQRGTITELAASPTTGLSVGSNVAFSVLLDTAGAPAVTSENITYLDGTTVIGTQPLTITNVTNLLPYAQDYTQWVLIANGAVGPTLSPLATAAADGTTLDPATVVAFPATPGTAESGIRLGIPGTAYAGQPMTASVFLQAAAPTTVTMQLTDSPQSSASQSQICNVQAIWTRCTLTYPFPTAAGTGVALALYETGSAAQSINVWGAQVEQSAAAGTYVYTDGAAQSRQGGASTFSTTGLLAGTHTITANYGGDANFIGSVSQPIILVVGQGTATIVLTESAASGVLGAPVTFTATLSGPVDTPTGTVTFMDGAVSIGTGTIAGGVATLTTTTLVSGTHTITAVYSGDTEFDPLTSSAMTYTVWKVNAGMTITSSINPSIYGQPITLTITMTGAAGVAPSGTVALLNGTTSLGTLSLTPSGATSTATLTLSTLDAGANNLSFTYSGDGNYN